MNALLAIPESDPRERPKLDAGIYVEPRDNDPRDEDARQAEFIAFMRKYCREMRTVGIPNAGKRSPWEASKRLREGMTAGEPDTATSWENAPTARIEFKDGRSMPDQNQIEALNWYHRRGHPVAVCRTAKGALKWLRSIGAPVPVERAL